MVVKELWMLWMFSEAVKRIVIDYRASTHLPPPLARLLLDIVDTYCLLSVSDSR